MTTFIKTKLKKSDDQTNIDKFRVAANILEYHIITKLIFRRIVIGVDVSAVGLGSNPSKTILNGDRDT